MVAPPTDGHCAMGWICINHVVHLHHLHCVCLSFQHQFRRTSCHNCIILHDGSGEKIFLACTKLGTEGNQPTKLAPKCLWKSRDKDHVWKRKCALKEELKCPKYFLLPQNCIFSAPTKQGS